MLSLKIFNIRCEYIESIVRHLKKRTKETKKKSYFCEELVADTVLLAILLKLGAINDHIPNFIIKYTACMYICEK